MLIGVIADDLTGATDVALALKSGGMRVVQIVGVPAAKLPAPDADAVVVALKSRTIAAKDAVAQSLAALAWLRANGARQVLFKYCSTFDSTAEGNIGPVADALADALGAAQAIFCPAFPKNRRTVYRGHLFVGDQLLSDSPMRDHPLTPMREANLARVLASQTRRRVGVVALDVVAAGTQAVRERLAALEREGVAYVIADAVTDADLATWARAVEGSPLVTGGSGIAFELPHNFTGLGMPALRDAAAPWKPIGGSCAVLSGSCSTATLGQVAAMAARYPSFSLDPLQGGDSLGLAARALEAAGDAVGRGPVLFYSTVEPARIQEIQRQLGREHAGDLVEQAFAELARRLVARGVRRLVVAGGETSGAVVQGLGVQALEIGAEIDPGVPWTRTLGEPRLALALKSGNFGGADFFTKALGMIE